ncbi:hypothetical protein NKH73_20555 [Mesorhizobium sp. M0938]|uniref:hypothetical protein n=1 Tax=unclassified Mesorhizobium TaxID=325217 RepID=UPI003335FEF2
MGITVAATLLVLNFGDAPTMAKDMSATGQIQEGSAVAPSLVDLRSASLNEMLEYRDLENGWDGVGSAMPDSHAINDAVDFLIALPAEILPPDPTASADGSVGWFWNQADASISIKFTGGGKFAYYAKSKSKALEARGLGVFDGKSIPDDLLQIMFLA